MINTNPTDNRPPSPYAATGSSPPDRFERIHVRARFQGHPLTKMFPRTLFDLAVDWLMSGDVTQTRCGWRVTLRSDSSNNRVAASACWKPDGRCRCWHNYECSHVLAMILAEGDQRKAVAS